MNNHISIINPEGTKQSSKGFINALSAYTILEISNLTGCMNIADYFTTNPALIYHRMDLFLDILNNGLLYNFLYETEDQLKGLELELNSRTAAINNGEPMLSKIYVLKYYIDMIDRMYDFLKNNSQNFKSEGLRNFSEQITAEAESEEYKIFKKNLSSFDDNIKDIHSITVGVNLDMQLHPKEAGIISINKEMYKSGNIIDKILRWDFKDDEYTCLAPLTSLNGPLSIQEQAESNKVINHAMDIVFMDTLKKCYEPIKKFINERYEMFIGLRDEIKFLLRGSEMLRSFKDANMPFCQPRISESEYSIKGLYNPFIIKSKDSGHIVLNDITFDDGGKIYILTGANSGGKSVFTLSVGIAQALFQAGIPVPAKSAVMCICDAIYTHLPVQDLETKAVKLIKDREGRLENEVKNAMNIVNKLTAGSLFLLDETFASTSSSDAARLSRNLIEKISTAGCKCIFSTHLHELAAMADDINKNVRGKSSKIDTLSVITVDGRRTYEVKRKKLAGSSLADDIAQKYGLV